MALSTTSADGRYYWYGNANGVTGGQITFVGNPAFLTGTAALTWTIMQRAGDGSYPVVTYSTHSDGSSPVSQQVGSEGTPQQTINESGLIKVSLNGATGFIINVTSGGGTPNPTAAQWVLALAITRNADETLPWDFPNPFDPAAFNFIEPPDMSGDPNTDTLANLRVRLLKDLGFSTQSASPPPGMAAYCNNVLYGAQKWLFRKYPALNTRRFFRWKMIPGQRFYSLKDNDDGPIANNGAPYILDPLKPIEWAGIQDTRNVWYPLIEGIPPQLYTMLTKPWRPARYTIRQGIEVYPAPDQTYWLWLRGHFGLMPFAADSDITTLDSELVYLYALARAKGHYGHADKNDVASMANSYRGELIAGTHKTAHYVPGTTPIPPAVRPTLIQYQDNQSG
jgi:hypothetical protein